MTKTPSSVHPAFCVKNAPEPESAPATTWLACDALEPAWKKAGNGPEAKR